MSAPIKLAPVEIALIRRAIPYLKRHMKIPARVERAVAKRGVNVKIRPEDVKKIAYYVTKGPVLLRLRGSHIVIRLASPDLFKRKKS